MFLSELIKVDFDTLEGMAIYSRNSLILHHKDRNGHLEMKSDQIGFNALKYLYLYQLMKQR